MPTLTTAPMKPSTAIHRSLSPCLRVLGVLAAGAVLALPATAMSIREMRTLEKVEKQGTTFSDYYLVGVMEGAVEAHNYAVRHGATASICLNGRALEPRMAKGLYTTELKRNVGLYEADMPVQLVMVNALTTVYPC